MPPGMLSSEFDCFIVLFELVDTQEGGSDWLGKRRSPAGGFVRGTRFVVQSLCGFGVGGSRSGRASVRSRL